MTSRGVNPHGSAIVGRPVHRGKTGLCYESENRNITRGGPSEFAMRHPHRIAALTVVGLLFAPALAQAHKMEVEAKTDGATVRVVAGYEGDEPTEGAKVTLADAAGAVVAEGTTDTKGLCVLPRPKAGAYTLAVDDGAGHRAELALPVPESEAEVTARTERRNRWLMAALGLAAIAGGTAVARLLRRRPAPTEAGSRG
jgi:hypothetical protein